MKLKKTLFTLANRLKTMTEKEVQEEILKLIESYELKIRYGATDQLIAFSNSIYTPTTKPDQLKEFELWEKKKMKKSEIFRTIRPLKNDIVMMRKEGTSHENIAKELSNTKVPNEKRKKRGKNKNKPYFNKTYIIRFCKDYSIL